MKTSIKILLAMMTSFMLITSYAGNAASGTGPNDTNSNETEPTTESHYATPGQTAAPETNTQQENSQLHNEEQQQMQQEQQQINQENQQFNNDMQPKNQNGGY